MDTKEQRFIRVAEARTNKIIDMINLLGNCSNKNNYAYSEKDVDRIFSRIEDELKAAKIKFISSSEKSQRFKLR